VVLAYIIYRFICERHKCKVEHTTSTQPRTPSEFDRSPLHIDIDAPHTYIAIYSCTQIAIQTAISLLVILIMAVTIMETRRL
jgi:hypothetical protein